MAIVFESSATGTGSSSTTVVVNKPSGLVVGDLLVAVGYGYRIWTSTTPPSGWTELWDGTLKDTFAYYKVATSTETAASNFTFTFNTSVTSKVVCYRISGFSGNTSDIYSVVGTDPNTASPTISASYDPIAPNSGVIMATSYSDSTSNARSSAYYITSAGTSPTFTEDFDEGYNVDEQDFALAHAVYTDSDAITAFGWTSSSATMSNQGGGLIVVRAQNNASGTTALLTPDTEFISPTASAGTSGTAALKSVSPTFSSGTAAANTGTTWQRPTKNSTTWYNENK